MDDNAWEEEFYKWFVSAIDSGGPHINKHPDQVVDFIRE